MNRKRALAVLPHPDDEIFLLPRILELLRLDYSFDFVYLTTSPGPLQCLRESESRSTLQDRGIPDARIHFLGREVDSRDGQLAESAHRVLDALETWIRDHGPFDEIFAPMWEGGHPDHDLCFQITMRVFESHLPDAVLYGFPLYQGEHLPWKFFRTHSILDRYRNRAITFPVRPRDAIITFLSIFRYRTQWKTFIGLGPFILWNLLLKKRMQLAHIEHGASITEKPHHGPLLYERYGRTTFQAVEHATLSLDRADDDPARR